jgi:hypothetical protein
MNDQTPMTKARVLGDRAATSRIGHSALGIHWELVIGNWSFANGHWSFANGH